MNSNTIYRIVNKETGDFLSTGSSKKNYWKSFKNAVTALFNVKKEVNPNMRKGINPEDFEVAKYQVIEEKEYSVCGGLSVKEFLSNEKKERERLKTQREADKRLQKEQDKESRRIKYEQLKREFDE
jgi:hypothetical protein